MLYGKIHRITPEQFYKHFCGQFYRHLCRKLQAPLQEVLQVRVREVLKAPLQEVLKAPLHEELLWNELVSGRYLSKKPYRTSQWHFTGVQKTISEKPQRPS